MLMIAIYHFYLITYKMNKQKNKYNNYFKRWGFPQLDKVVISKSKTAKVAKQAQMRNIH